MDRDVRATLGFGASWRYLVLVQFALFGALTLVFIAVAVDDIPVLVGLWCLAYLWNGVWWLWLISYRIELTATALRWYTPLRSGEMALGAVRRADTGGIWFLARIVAEDGSRIRCVPVKGLAPFLERVGAAAPRAEVRIRWLARLYESLPGQSRLRRH